MDYARLLLRVSLFSSIRDCTVRFRLSRPPLRV